MNLRTKIAEMEERLITSALLEAKGHKEQACKALGISRPTLDKKIQQYGIKVSKSWPGALARVREGKHGP